MTLMKTPVCEFDQNALNFDLPGVDGKQWNLEKCRGQNGTLIMFICNHCPYVKVIREKLVKEILVLNELGINSVAIMSNDPLDYPEDSFENMQRVAKEFHFPFPYLLDEAQTVAKEYGAICTPDFFGYNANLKLQYRGRLDSSGMQENVIAERDLYLAMKMVAETGKGPEEQIPSMGCSIKWKN